MSPQAVRHTASRPRPRARGLQGELARLQIQKQSLEGALAAPLLRATAAPLSSKGAVFDVPNSPYTS